MLCHGRWNCRLNAVLRLLLRRKRKDNLIENALFKQKLLTKVIGICLWPARYLAFIAHRDTLVWGECKVYRVKQKVLSRSQDALNCIAQTLLQLYIHWWPPWCFITSIVPSAQMDCHNSDFSGSFGDFWQQPWALSVPGEGDKMSFTLAFSQAQEREQLFRRQTKPSLGVADALDVACTRLHCHHSSIKAPTGSHWRGRRQWCVWDVGFGCISVCCAPGQQSSLVWAPAQPRQLQPLPLPVCWGLERAGQGRPSLHISLGWLYGNCFSVLLAEEITEPFLFQIEHAALEHRTRTVNRFFPLCQFNMVQLGFCTVAFCSFP